MGPGSIPGADTKHFKIPYLHKGPIAQWLEQLPHKVLVVGSNPTRPTLTMKLQLENPYQKIWKKAYLVKNKQNRRMVILYNNHKDRSTTPYSRYLMAVKIGRILTKKEEVDHIDDDKTNDEISNLQVLTPKENAKKEGLARRLKPIHGSLTTYRYCKCEICKLGRKLWNNKKFGEYKKLLNKNPIQK